MGEDASQRRALGARLRAPTAHGVSRFRLDGRLDRLWDHRLGLVVGPAGCGKTTLLAQFTSRIGVPVAWYRAEADDVTERALAAHLGRSLSDALGLDITGRSVSALADALESWQGERALLVVDDLHLLSGTPSESAIDRMIGYLPAGMCLLAASRCVPGFNLSRLRLSEAVLELGADDLRFRAWEVERLFHDFYDEPLPPDELAELARRTEGWAAGLQLFHLATRSKTPAQRHAMVVALGSRSKLVREYLAHNVLDDLGEDLREFLLRTTVLGHVSGPLCDDLLGRSGSAAVLEELERRQIFTLAVDDDGGYRYHEALRTYLDSALVQRLGEGPVRAEYRRAGRLLESAGLAADALLAYCRGEDDDAAARLLGTDGEHVVAQPGAWLEALPPTLVAADPWLQLARARRYVGAGMLPGALQAYQSAERAFGRDHAADTCRRERRAVAIWQASEPSTGDEWVDLARAATRRDPLAAMRKAARLSGAVGRVVEGAAACLGGRVDEGRAVMAAATALPDAGPTLIMVADVVSALGGLLVGETTATDGAAGSDANGDRRGVPALERVGRAAVAGTGDRSQAEEVASLQAAARRVGDDWGRAIMCLCDGMAANWRAQPSVPALHSAVESFRTLGAPVLEAWATSGLAVALALTGNPAAREAGHQALTLGTAVNSFGSSALALRSLAMSDPRRADHHETEASKLVEKHQLQVGDVRRVRAAGSGRGELGRPVVPEPPDAAGTPLAMDGAGRPQPLAGKGSTPPVDIRCFGRFEMWIGSELVPTSTLKPKARSTLRLLAMRAGRPVHRDTLVDALWPEADVRAATRCLQVVISSLRQVMEPRTTRGAYSVLVRDGDAYRLVVHDAGDADVTRFQRAVADGRAARVRNEPEGAIAAFEAALDAYGGDLLPEEGPAEWVVTERDHFRAQAADVAHALAGVLMDRDDPVAAAAACERGLAIDRYRDELWQSLIEASDRAGRHAGAARARHHYDAVLAELA